MNSFTDTIKFLVDIASVLAAVIIPLIVMRTTLRHDRISAHEQERLSLLPFFTFDISDINSGKTSWDLYCKDFTIQLTNAGANSAVHPEVYDCGPGIGDYSITPLHPAAFTYSRRHISDAVIVKPGGHYTVSIEIRVTDNSLSDKELSRTRSLSFDLAFSDLMGNLYMQRIVIQYHPSDPADMSRFISAPELIPDNHQQP